MLRIWLCNILPEHLKEDPPVPSVSEPMPTQEGGGGVGGVNDVSNAISITPSVQESEPLVPVPEEDIVTQSDNKSNIGRITCATTTACWRDFIIMARDLSPPQEDSPPPLPSADGQMSTLDWDRPTHR